MYFAIFTLFTALTISVIAAWYSIVGLTAIFAAAFLPIILMGGSLEVGKVVTAVWLHRNWYHANTLMKTYLTTATILLMFITSMGIFGFLSKAHVEQTAASVENVAKIEQYSNEIERQNLVVNRANVKIESLETADSKTDTTTQDQIDKEQQRIDFAYDRINPAIAEQNEIIDGQTKLYFDQLVIIDAKIQKLQEYIDNGEIKKAQGMIGTKADGAWGTDTVIQFKRWTAEKEGERQVLIAKIENMSQNNTAILAARQEIIRLRQSADTQIAQSNKLINRLREKLGNVEASNTDELIDAQYVRISKATLIIEDLTEKKYTIEGEYRKLEAEVGPIKYIAEFVYGETADQHMLEQAVRWVIIILVLVFDPLAICLILAGAQQLEWSRKEGGGRTPPPPKKVFTRFEPDNEIIVDSVADDEPEPIIQHVDDLGEETKDTIIDSIDPTPEVVVPSEPVMPENETIKEHEIFEAAVEKGHRNLKENEAEKKQIIKDIQRAENAPRNVLPPRKVASVNSVAGVGKPFNKSHK